MWHTKQYPLDKDILLLPEEKAFQSFEKRLRRTCGYLEFLSWTGLWENSHLGTLSPQWNQWSGWYPNTVRIHKGIVYFRGYTSHTLGNSTVLCCSYNIYIYITETFTIISCLLKRESCRQLCRRRMVQTGLCSPVYQLRSDIFIFDFLNVVRCIYNVQ